MTIRFACRCGKKMKTSDDKIGKKVLCSACGSPVVVPSDNTVSIEKVVAPAAGSDAADTASALLRGTATQQQKKTRKNIAYDDPSLNPESTFDATETAKYISKGFLLPASGVVVACLAIYVFSNWMVRGRPNLPPLAEVTGAVYLDGEPLPGVEVMLRLKKENAIEDSKASASLGRTDSKGRYKLRYTQDVDGAPIGVCTVQLSALSADGKNVIPPRYRDRTETREVRKGGNEFDFQLSSKSTE